MTVDHPQFGLMCEICFKGLTESECAVDTNGQRWDLCKGDCARHAGIIEDPGARVVELRNDTEEHTRPQ